jgi:hypothetical protein
LHFHRCLCLIEERMNNLNGGKPPVPKARLIVCAWRSLPLAKIEFHLETAWRMLPLQQL